MDSESNSTNFSEDQRLYQAIKKDKMEEIKLLLEDGRNLNDPVVTTGPFAGYTALHVACMENNDELVYSLIREYKVDVNVVAEDGTRPIHLVCLYETLKGGFQSSLRRLQILMDAKANANVELHREMFYKHVKNRDWFPDFGDKMTLGAYTVISNQYFLTDELAMMGANLKIISPTNKTLAMYIIERLHWYSVGTVLVNSSDPEYLNHRDNDGIPATHYLFHPKIYGDYRYDGIQQFGLISDHRHTILPLLHTLGADMYALLNDDPATFLPNIAAYRSCSKTLKSILPYYTYMSLSKALYYATLPIDGNSDNCIHLVPKMNAEKDKLLSDLQEQRKECIELILKDLINRLTFGLHVPAGEKELMEKLISADTDIKKFVHNYQTDFIQGELKNKFIDLGDKKMTLYDFIMNVYDDRKLQLMARDNTLLVRFRGANSDNPHQDYYYFKFPIRKRIEYGIERLKLLKTLEKISTLTEAIPLPYELILDIVEYLNNSELDIFTKAFTSSL